MENLIELQKKMVAIQVVAQWVFHDDEEVTLASFEDGQMRLSLDHKGNFDLEEWFQPHEISDALQRLAVGVYNSLVDERDSDNRETFLDECGYLSNKERAEEVIAAFNWLKNAGFEIVEKPVFIGEIEECTDCGEQIENCECAE